MAELKLIEETEIMLAIAEGQGKRYVLKRTCEYLAEYLEKKEINKKHVETEIKAIKAMIVRDYCSVGKRIPEQLQTPILD